MFQEFEFEGSRITVNDVLSNASRAKHNLESILELSSDYDLLVGTQWYTIAHGIARNIADHYDLSLSKIIGVIAALSPNIQWEVNLDDTLKILDGGNPSAYGKNISKAFDILNDHPPDKILGGSKVRNFYLNLLNPADCDAITIDVHATKVLYAWHENGISPTRYISDGKYKLAQDIYHKVARGYDLLGQQVQAIAWTTYKRLFTTKSGNRAINFPAYLFAPLSIADNPLPQDHENYLVALQSYVDNNNNISRQLQLL